MKALKALIIAGTALIVSSTAFAGRDQAQIVQQERAMKRTQAEQALPGLTGEQRKVEPGTKPRPRGYNIGHPTERVRR